MSTRTISVHLDARILRGCGAPVLAGAIVLIAGVNCSPAKVANNESTGGQGQAGAGGGTGGGGAAATGGTGGSGTCGIVGCVNRADAGTISVKNCGDGKLDPGEQCDDGNRNNGDGCNAICQIEADYLCPTPGQPCVDQRVCGNGKLTSNEVCDDGNTVSGDGCSADCQKIEPGYQCRVPGKPCTPFCGDGVITASEACDDGNTQSGDGCSATCKIEIGYKCSGQPSKCTPTTCGDGKVEGAEGCDDGNTVPFDGCSEDCQIEPHCSGTSGCTSKCGDGIVLGEKCDDGNQADGDGCSKTCQIEPGWTCTQPDTRRQDDGSGDLPRLQVPQSRRISRAGLTGSYAPFTGHGQRDSRCQWQARVLRYRRQRPCGKRDSFAEWYRRHVRASTTQPRPRLTLWNDGKGNYVNRYGANGEQWNITNMAYYCGSVGREKTDAAGNPIPCTFSTRAANPTQCDTMIDCREETIAHPCSQANNGHLQATTLSSPRSTATRSSSRSTTILFTSADGAQAVATIPPYYDAGNLAIGRGRQRQRASCTISVSPAKSAIGSSTTSQELHPRLRRRRRCVGLHQPKARGRPGRHSYPRGWHIVTVQRQRHHDHHPDLSHPSATAIKQSASLGLQNGRFTKSRFSRPNARPPARRTS